MSQRTADTAEVVDALVVGTGFGGSVSAWRLASSGLQVVVMERGRSYPPGSFARTPAEFSENFWSPDDACSACSRPGASVGSKEWSRAGWAADR